MLFLSTDITKPLMLAKVGTLSLVLLLGVVMIQDAKAQVPRQGQQPPPSQRFPPPRGQQPQQEDQQPQQVQPEESDPLIHGITVHVGINNYQGDLSNNPNNNVLKFIGLGDISSTIGIDHRFGEFDQYGLNVDLTYDHYYARHVFGERLLEHSNSLISLDFVADYELPYIEQGLFRVFAGGGPAFVVAPWYGRFPGGNELFDTSLTTRPIGTAVVGVSIFEVVRIGTRITSTDFLDGYAGFEGEGFPDVLGFVTVGYRFDRKN